MTSPLRITRDLCFMALISRYGGKPRRHHWSERRWKVHVHQGGYGAVTTVRRMWVKVFGKSLRELSPCRLRASAGICGLGFSRQRHGCRAHGPLRAALARAAPDQTGSGDRSRKPRKGENASLCEPADRQSFRRSAATGLSRQGLGAGKRLVSNGRAFVADAATESAIITLLRELKSRGKTLLVVHHDLASAREYFDMLILLNMRLVAFGPTSEVFTPELLQTTYGGRLTILSDVVQTLGTQA